MMSCIVSLLLAGFPLIFPVQGRGQPPPLKVVTSVFPLHQFASLIGLDRAEVHLLLPPGAGVHTWQPRASDILLLSSADLFIHIGGGLEPWIPDLLKSLPGPGPRVLAMARALSIHESGEGDNDQEHDPHIWMDFELDQLIVDQIAAALSEIDPANRAFFNERAGSVKSRLQKLDASYVQGLDGCRSRTLLVGGHAAFGYLARRYGLEQVSIYGLSPDAEATPGRLIDAIELGRKSRIKAVFTEANSSSRMATLIAKELKVEVLPLHPAANLNKQEWESRLTFFDIMEENLVNLRKGLACD